MLGSSFLGFLEGVEVVVEVETSFSIRFRVVVKVDLPWSTWPMKLTVTLWRGERARAC